MKTDVMFSSATDRWSTPQDFFDALDAEFHFTLDPCADESKKPGTTVVLLIPARTDRASFHDYIWGKAEIRFVRGRLRFGDGKNPAPFPSMVCVFR